MTSFRWADRAQGRSTKRHHSAAAIEAKIEIRERIAARFERPSVFDVFAGNGGMFRAVWQPLDADYTGADLRWFSDERLAYVGDYRRILRALDMRQFNIFDIDPFGSPWECAWIIAERRGQLASGDTIGFALTEGGSLSARQTRLAKGLPTLTGFARDVRGVHYDIVIDRAVAGLAKKMGATVEARWQAKQKTGAQMRYIGLVLRGADA